MLGKLLFNLGYHVVTVPNTIHFQYSLGISATGAPGYLPDDAKEYFSMLKEIATYLQTSKGWQISDYSIVGSSLGGLVAGFVAQEDLQEKFFNFKKIVMLNPAVDLGYAMGVLDNYFVQGNSISDSRKNVIKSRIISAGLDIMEKGFTVPNVETAVKFLKLSDAEKQWLIGETFRSSLRDVVFASQQINDLHVLKMPITKGLQNARLTEAFSLSFNDYLHRIIVPTLQNKVLASPEELLARSGMYAIGASLKSNKKLYIFTNSDDFFQRKEDLEFMQSLVEEDRFYLYPYGGHGGNFWYPQNQSDFQTIMQL